MIECLVVLKRAKVPCKNLRLLYTTCIITVLDYVVFVFYYYLLEKSLMRKLERLQKRTLAVMCPGVKYNETRTRIDYHRNVCNALFNDIFNDESHTLRYLLPSLHKFTRYTLRHTKSFQGLKVETNRAKNTLIISSILNFDTI